jgi:RNA polymerase sigma-70 factor, ECF subfamily
MGTGDTSERALLKRLARMDQWAWRWLFNTYGDAIYGFCLRMVRSPEDARDIRQEVLARAVGAIGKFRGDASIKTWLLQIARNLCLTHIAAAKKNMECGSDHDLLANLASEEPGGDCSMANSELRKALELAIGELEPVFREAILLREVEGLSYDQIAEVTGVSVDTVKTRIHRARLKLRKRLGEFR